MEILAVSMVRLKTDGDMPLEAMAIRTNGWSAAQLSSLWTEAALLAAADSRRSICDEDLVEGFYRVQARLEKVSGSGSNAS